MFDVSFAVKNSLASKTDGAHFKSATGVLFFLVRMLEVCKESGGSARACDVSAVCIAFTLPFFENLFTDAE